MGVLKKYWHGGLEEEAGRSPFAGNGLEGALTEQKSVAAPTEGPWGWEIVSPGNVPCLAAG